MRNLFLIAILFFAGCGHDRGDNFWLGSMIAAQSADYYTTIDYLDSGGSEANPILGRYPNDESVLLFKASVIGITYTAGQVWPKHRRTFYKLMTISGTGAAAWNIHRRSEHD